MENNDVKQVLTKDDLVSALSELMKEKTPKKEEQVAAPSPSQEEIFSAVEKYLEKRESQKKAQEILAKADDLSSTEEIDPIYESSSADTLETLRMRLEKHIDNIQGFLKYENFDSKLVDSQFRNKNIDAYRVFWHSICHNKGGKEGSKFIIDQIRTKGIKDPSAYLLKY